MTTTSMNRCTRCGGAFPSRTSGITGNGPFCLTSQMCDDNLVAAQREQLQIDLSIALSSIIRQRGARPQTLRDAIEEWGTHFTPAFRRALYSYGVGAEITSIHARYVEDSTAPAALALVGDLMTALHAELSKGGR